ncbi:MAG: ribonuclease HII [Flavobacteriaceae bacterium]|nr:ribonuclease HII [Flavobacteriaceae bacterium]
MINTFQDKLTEVGVDEAGRGCLAGPVVAAAVILPADYKHHLLNDSKKVSEKNRLILKKDIEEKAISYAVGIVDIKTIDDINILQSAILAMHKAIDKLKVKPEFIAVDGNKFNNYKDIPHQTVIKGDGKILNIAAASILAKTYRDQIMTDLDKQHPEYLWSKNKGYPTKAHREMIRKHGVNLNHRTSFKLL